MAAVFVPYLLCMFPLLSFVSCVATGIYFLLRSAAAQRMRKYSTRTGLGSHTHDSGKMTLIAHAHGRHVRRGSDVTGEPYLNKGKSLQALGMLSGYCGDFPWPLFLGYW